MTKLEKPIYIVTVVYQHDMDIEHRKIFGLNVIVQNVNQEISILFKHVLAIFIKTFGRLNKVNSICK